MVYLILFPEDSKEFGLLFLKLLQNGRSILPNGWYVGVIIIMYIGFYISFRRLTKEMALLSVSLLCIIFICVIRSLGWSPHWYVSILAFPLGLVYSQYEQLFLDIYNKRRSLLITPVCLFMILGLFMLHNDWARILIYIPMNIMFVSLISCIDMCKIESKLITTVSGISYEIYLCHGVVIKFMGGVNNNLLLVFITLLFTIVFAYSVKIMSEKISLVLFK